MRRHTFEIAGYLLALALILVGSQARAAVVHDEDSDGDFSGLYTDPTPLNLLPGTNSIIASTGIFQDIEDLEYVRINLPAGHVLSQLKLNFYIGSDPTSFIAVQSGSAFTFPANMAGANINNMLGWTHFGPGVMHVNGTDLLPIIGANSQGFVPPLTGPTYTFWIQQTGNTTDYQLDFIVTPVPEPATWVLVGMTVLAGTSTRRIWRRRSRNRRD